MHCLTSISYEKHTPLDPLKSQCSGVDNKLTHSFDCAICGLLLDRLPSTCLLLSTIHISYIMCHVSIISHRKNENLSWIVCILLVSLENLLELVSNIFSHLPKIWAVMCSSLTLLPFNPFCSYGLTYLVAVDWIFVHIPGLPLTQYPSDRQPLTVFQSICPLEFVRLLPSVHPRACLSRPSQFPQGLNTSTQTAKFLTPDSIWSF